MGPCNHTKLMNYLIGMCKRHKDWICPLGDLGYELQLVEQRIRTAAGESVKPDIVATSNKLLHSLVLECKGGTQIDIDQLKRYDTLTEGDLLRWVNVFTTNGFHFDVCVSDLRENHPSIFPHIKNMFPTITFDSEVFKTGDFKENKLNESLRQPISLKNKTPPLFYYPFCEDDDDAYITPFVIRGLVSIAMKKVKGKGNPGVFEEELITTDAIVRTVFNPIFQALSDQHRGRLKEKIKEIIHLLLEDEHMKEVLGIIEQRSGIKIESFEKLSKESERIIEQLRTQRSITNFIQKTSQ